MTSFKAVFTDMDGTLLASDNKMSAYTTEVLTKLQNSGVTLIFATGRPYPAVFHTIDSSGITPDFVVSSNGARIHDKNRNIVTRHDLSPEIVKDLSRLKQQPHADGTVTTSSPVKTFSSNFYPEEKWYSDCPSQEIIEAFFHSILPTKVDFEQCEESHFENVHEMWFMGKTEDLLALKKYVETRHNGKVKVMMSMPTVIDVVDKDVNKGNAVKELCNKLGFSLDEVVCFGDSMNDEPMLRVVPHSFVMANALPLLREALPDKEVILSNEEDGVAKKIVELFHL